jgi:hypothetical protein
MGLAEAKVLQEMIDPRSGPPLLDVAALTVTRDELTFLDSLAPLMGDTPRSVKRFVNVYQLVKILRRGRSVSDGFPPDEQLTAFLLAVAEGLPELGWRLFDEVADGVAKTPLSMLLNAPVFMQCPAELKCAKEWLARNPIWNAVPADRIADLATDVGRFLFRVAPRGGPGTGAQAPQVVHVIQHP